MDNMAYCRRDIEIGVEFSILLVNIAVWVVGFDISHRTSHIMADWSHCGNRNIGLPLADGGQAIHQPFPILLVGSDQVMGIKGWGCHVWFIISERGAWYL
jgi:hypothetical protein